MKQLYILTLFLLLTSCVNKKNAQLSDEELSPEQKQEFSSEHTCAYQLAIALENTFKTNTQNPNDLTKRKVKWDDPDFEKKLLAAIETYRKEQLALMIKKIEEDTEEAIKRDNRYKKYLLEILPQQKADMQYMIYSASISTIFSMNDKNIKKIPHQSTLYDLIKLSAPTFRNFCLKNSTNPDYFRFAIEKFIFQNRSTNDQIDFTNQKEMERFIN
jgi:hypothetical protein